MKFQVMMSVVIEARTPQEAQDHAVKLKELVKTRSRGWRSRVTA
jgi:hypothetical protein